MAYAAVVTVTESVIAQRKHYIVNVVETEGAAASQFQILPATLPRVGRIISHKATKTAGSAATIAPKVGTATGWSASTQDALYAIGAAAHVFSAPTSPAGVFRQTTGLWVVSAPNAGADNTIHTQIIIVEGVE